MPQVDLGQVVGPQGPQGEPGPAGPQGIQGPPGQDATLPSGGSAGQVLAKTDDGFAWENRQDTLTGAPGQVVGFDATGAALPVRRWSNHNLLDDAYFLYPINQLGVSGTITAPGYFIDRWKLVSGSVTITAGGLVLNGTIVQILEQSIGEETIASVLTTEGVTAAAYDDESRTFAITASGQTLIAAKLELGSIQTVAYQNADGSLVLNDPPPKKALELAQCQRYYEDLGWVTMIITGTTLDVTVPFKVPKRSIPTSTCYSANNVSGKISYYTGSVWADHDASLEIAGPRLPINGQRIRATGLPNNAIARFRIVSDANL